MMVVNLFIGVAVDEVWRLADEYEIWAIRVRSDMCSMCRGLLSGLRDDLLERGLIGWLTNR